MRAAFNSLQLHTASHTLERNWLAGARHDYEARGTELIGRWWHRQMRGPLRQKIVASEERQRLQEDQHACSRTQPRRLTHRDGRLLDMHDTATNGNVTVRFPVR